MHALATKLHKYTSLILICLLLAPTAATAAPKPLDPGTVHVKIMKRGVGKWIAVQENNGVQLVGRILSIDDHSFTLQLHNDPQTTEILYSDVQYLQTGFTTGQKVFLFASIGAAAGFAIWGFVHVHDLSQRTLPQPTLP